MKKEKNKIIKCEKDGTPLLTGSEDGKWCSEIKYCPICRGGTEAPCRKCGYIFFMKNRSQKNCPNCGEGHIS